MKKPPIAPAVRFHVEPAYVPAEKAARRMGLTLTQFRDYCPRLYARGFPVPDETTGLYDLEAMDRWRKRQRPDLYPEMANGSAEPIKTPPRKDLGEIFAEAMKAKRASLPQRPTQRVRRLPQ